MSTRISETTYCTLGKLSMPKKDQWSKKGRNWKKGSYRKKAPIGDAYQN
jgi:hypothetical protein